MYLLIPLNGLDEDATISSLADAIAWAVVQPKEGIKIYGDKSEIDEIIDYLVVENHNEDVDEFLDEGIEVLVAPYQKSIDEIIEAYMFRELHDKKY